MLLNSINVSYHIFSDYDQHLLKKRESNKMQCLSTHLVIPVRNHCNGKCHFVLELIDCAACGVLVQRQNLFLQLMNAFFQQKQLTGIQVDLFAMI